MVVMDGRHCRDRGAVCTELRLDLQPAMRCRPTPPGVDSSYGGHGQRLTRAHGPRPVDWRDVQNVPRLAIRSGPANLQAPTLADGKPMGSVVFADDRTVFVHHRPGRLAKLVAQKACGITVGDEADVVAVGLARKGQTGPLGLLAHVALICVAEWEQSMGELVGGQDAQDVRLVLVRIDGAMQLRTLRTADHACIMSRTDRVEAPRQRAVEDGGEFDLLVAAE